MDDEDDDRVMSRGPVPEAAAPRFLLAAVYIMGGLLVLMFLAIIAGIVWKVLDRAGAPPAAPKVIGAGLAPGTAIESVSLSGDTVAIRAGDEIVVIDIKKGSVTGRVKLYGD
jgi:hypothetical protein